MNNYCSKTIKHLFLSLLIFVSAAGCDNHLFMSEEALIEQAQHYSDNKQYSAAIVNLKKAIQKNPKNGLSRFLLGELYLNLGDFPAAQKEFNRARQHNYPIDELIQPLSQAMLAQGAFDDILSSLKSISGLSDEAMLNKDLMLANAYLGLGKHEKAEELLRSVLQRDDRNSDATLGLAKLAYAANKPEQSLELVNKSAGLDTHNLNALFFKSSLELHQNNFADAENTLSQALEIAKTQPSLVQLISAKNALANVLIKQQKYDAALSLLLVKIEAMQTPPLTNYLTAVAYLNTADLDNAEKYAKKVLKVQPQHSLSKLLLGTVFFEKQDNRSAITFLSDFVAAKPNHTGAKKYLASAYVRNNQASEAFSILYPALSNKNVQPDVGAYLLAANVSRKIGKPEQGIELINKGLKENPDNAALEYEWAKTGLAAGLVQPSITKLESLQKIQPDSIDVKTLLARAYNQSKQPEKALALVENISSITGETANTNMLRGKIFATQKQYSQAREYFQKVIADDSTNIEALFGVANTYQLEQQWDLARETYLEIVNADNGHMQSLLNLAELALRKQDKTKALDWLSQARDKNPGAILPSVLLSNFYLESKDFDQARLILDEITLKHPNAISIIKTRGRLELASGKPESAISAFKMVLKRNPNNAAIWFQLSRAYLQLNNLTAARKALEESVRISPGALKPSVALIRINIFSGEFVAAEKDIQALIHNYPTLGIGHELLGDSHGKQAKHTLAASAYREAYKRSPTPNLIIKIFHAMKNAGDHAKATKFLANQVKNNPNELHLSLILANTYQSSGQPEKAKEYYEKILALDPSNVVALNNLAWIYLNENNPISVSYAEKAYKISQTYEIADTYGWTLVRNGHHTAGIEKIRESLNTGGQAVPEINYHLAYGLAQSGMTGKAKEILQQLLAEHSQFEGVDAARDLMKTLK